MVRIDLDMDNKKQQITTRQVLNKEFSVKNKKELRNELNEIIKKINRFNEKSTFKISSIINIKTIVE